MDRFIETGFNASTLTTVDDPSLRIVERDNGIRWHICFEVDDTSIDYINLENPRGYTLHEDVKKLSVYSEDNRLVGTVEEVYNNALELDNSLQQAYRNMALKAGQALDEANDNEHED
jgi:hypothetical protein